jgi:phosphoribosyl-ATP pyrophosphohydrolase
VVLCVDPERTRASRIVPQVFPKSSIVYKVTTQKEFKDTLNQFYGAPAYEDDIYKLLSDPGTQDEAGQLHQERARLLQETADLWLCSLVLLRRYRLALPDVLAELRRREGASDFDERADR